MAAHRKILCLDFDGVLHQYTRPWVNARTIPDEPVPGAMRFLIDAQFSFDVCVFSSRSHQWGGRRAMRRWLRAWVVRDLWDTQSKNWPEVALDYWDDFSGGGLPAEDGVKALARFLVGRVRFPIFKPPAHLTIDDRAIRFTGTFPDLREVLDFKPWNLVRGGDR